MFKKWFRYSALLFTVSFLLLIAAPSKAENSSALTFDNLDPVNTSLAAYKNVNDYLDKLPKTSAKPILHISDEASKREYLSYLVGLERISTLWSELVTPGELNVVLFTEKDSDWVDKKQIELTGEWKMDNELQSSRLKKYGCNIGGMYLPGVLFFCVKDRVESPGVPEYFPQAHLYAHEYTHYMEMKVRNWMGYVKGTSIGKRNTCWNEEGFATFYGFAVGSNPFGVDGKDRRKFVSELLWNYDDRRNQPHGTLEAQIRLGKVQETKRLFAMLENTPWPCDETQNAYALGSLAAEALVAIKGHEGMVKFYRASARTGDWRVSFQEAFGISVDTFYEKLTPYLASQFTSSNFVYASPSPTAMVTPKASPTPTPSPSASSTPEVIVSIKPSTAPSVITKLAKKITITCIRGKTVKKVTSINPKCPVGYKKKS